jgi:hypothetical protein
MTDHDIKQVVKEQYGKAALKVAAGTRSTCCSSTCCGSSATPESDPISSNLYTESETACLPAEAVAGSLARFIHERTRI